MSGGPGAVVGEAAGGARAVMVEGTGSGSSAWAAGGLPLQPGGLYRLWFSGRRDAGASGGCDITGPGRVNRDFRLGAAWARHGFVFTVPEGGGGDPLRFGQWEVRGRVYYDDVELLPAQVAHREVMRGDPPLLLGEAESITAGVYQFSPVFGWDGSNFHRPLWRNRAHFNSDRWVFGPGAEVVYQFALPGLVQSDATVRVNVNHFAGGRLRVEASRDGSAWLPVGAFDGARPAGTDALPAPLFPAAAIFLRLGFEGDAGALQVNACDYRANLAGPPLQDLGTRRIDGHSRFVELLETDDALALDAVRVDAGAGGGLLRCEFTATNRTAGPLSLDARLGGPGLAAGGQSGTRIAAPPGKPQTHTLHIRAAAPGPHTLELALAGADGRTLARARAQVLLGLLDDPRAGYRLDGVAGAGPLRLWWCEGGWKPGSRIGPAAVDAMPAQRAVAVAAAGGEDEPAQLVLTPTSGATLRAAAAAPFRNPAGEPAPIELRVDAVAYLTVTRPTDPSAQAGDYPDPLPPLRAPLPLAAGRSQPLWLTFRVPRGTKAGDYASELLLDVDGRTLCVPLAVHVFGFDLPRETHLRSAFGLGTHAINEFHRLATREQQEQVHEKYLANFAAHRIAPYSFFDHAPIDVRFVGEGAAKRAVVDFTRFDAAARRWLDEARFNTFMLPLLGMGGGTFHSRSLGSLEGFQEGTPEFARLFGDYLGQVERHLRDRGWLDKAFTYWFDEPDPKDYPFVVDGMKRIRAAAPGLRRMLTEQPEPELSGHVDIWCGLTPEWTPDKVRARRAAGEEVWWYVCTGPKAPYITLFIDHPATEMRLWPWQSWQYGVQGILVWASTYWTSTAAFPPPSRQDPWADPMGYVSGYSFGPGHLGYWGNGDGRFLYPPPSGGPDDTAPRLDGPVNSIRWENLRDGMEDYEYFWLLDQAVLAAERAGRQRGLLAAARALLQVPPEVSQDLTRFTTDPRPLLAHRGKLARMIERLTPDPPAGRAPR